MKIRRNIQLLFSTVEHWKKILNFQVFSRQPRRSTNPKSSKKYLYIRLEQKVLFKVDLSDLAPHHHLRLLNLLI